MGSGAANQPVGAWQRPVVLSYQDPLELVWLTTAARCGLRVERSEAVFASFDGQQTLTLGSPTTLDPDDCLGQMIFHELCHGLVEWPEGLGAPDWGLDNVDERHLPHEHACLRLQAALAERHGLRAFFAPTTDHRRYYDALSTDPFAEPDDSSRALALRAWERANHGRWAGPIEAALAATAALVRAVGPFASERSLWASGEPRSRTPND